MAVRGMVTTQSTRSDTARLRMKMFLVLACTLLATEDTRMEMLPRKPRTVMVK